MKKIIKSLTAIVTGGALAACSSAFAQGTFIKNDLYVGFQNEAGGGTANYIVNIGPASSIVGGSSVVPLSSDFSESDFTAIEGTNASTIFGGVVAATNTISSANPADVYVTQFRNGGAGNPAVAGSTAPAAINRTADNGAATALSQINAPAAGQGVLDTSLTWQNFVEPTFNTSSFYGQVGANPDSPVTPSSVVYEDLWYTAQGALSGTAPFTYLGYFTLNFTGSSAVVTFTPKAAPAPLTNPDITSVTYSGTTVTVIWTAVPPHSYQLQYTTSLNSPVSWNNVGSPLTASTSTLTESDTAAAGPERYYRVTGQ